MFDFHGIEDKLLEENFIKLAEKVWKKQSRTTNTRYKQVGQ